MAHIIGRILYRGSVAGYLAQENDGSLIGYHTAMITQNIQNFPNVELFEDKRYGKVYRERGTSDKLLNYFNYVGIPSSIMHFNALIKEPSVRGSHIVIAKLGGGVYSVLTAQGVILKVTEQQLINSPYPIYNMVYRGGRLCATHNFHVFDCSPKTIAADVHSIVLDTETTGVNPELGDEVLQLGIIDGKGKVIYNKKFKPIRHTEWPSATVVNHITPDMLVNCPLFSSEVPKINAIIATAKSIIGYNTQFDLRMLKCNGVTIPDVPTVDVMHEFAPIFGQLNEKFGTYRWKNLETCANFYRYDWGNDSAHDAIADCKATLYCYKAMRK